MKASKLAPLVALAAVVGMAAAPVPTVAPAPDRAALASQVREELLHAWRGYERYAWGHDELEPVSRTAHDWHRESLLMTPVDALDTLLLLGLKDEAARAKDLIVGKLSFDKDISVKNFEITIRILGGLLSADQATGDPRLLRLAEDLGTRLLPAFSSPTGMPYMYVNLKSGKTSGARSNPAEIGTLLLEFGTLSKLTGKPVFYEKAKKALVALYSRRSALGLVGEEIDVETGQWLSRASHVGGGIDSYYEYLLKCGRLFGDADCERMWTESLQALNAHLADEAPSGLWYGQVDMTTGKRTATEFGALHAFLPGVLGLGGDLGHARRLQESCFKMWNLRGIEPELLDYRRMRVVSPGYPLRPEIIESAFYLHRLTKDPRYLEMGRTFFDSIRAHCRTDAGDTVLKSVVTMEKGDLMPSYFLAETLKYLYLLFSEEPVDLEKVVFNTEAHPLRENVVSAAAPAVAEGGAKLRTLPIFFAFFVMGFVDAVGTLVGFAKTEFRLTGAEAGLLPFFGFAAFALFSVPAGVLADRRGKRFLLLLSLGVVLAGQLVASLSVSSYAWLLGAIFLIGVGMAALQVAGNPMMRDVSAPGRYARNLTFAQFLKSLGSISGPYLTTLVVALGLAWYRIFPIFAAVTLVTLLLAFFVSASEAADEDRPASVSASFALLKEPPVALAVLGIFLYVGAEVGLNSWLATFLGRSFGMDLASSATRLGPGLFFIALSVGRLVGSFVLNFVDARRFFRLSALLGLSGLGLLFVGHRSAALSGIVLCGLGFANIWPLVFALTIERRPERSGALSGLMCMAIFGGAALPALMGAMADRAGVQSAFLVPLACFAYLAALAFLGRRSATS